ncbi:hypothetical protein EI42_01069 [Thermosporothrix hazakensis]|uniref:MalT-like TPR region domain-containing protein n=1 Tax=Thermosporothrix hazakensis TaxID=644383 RepID=A0A326UB69_THEHA|nr:hypothetical protein [Thermosporothrix hazakensis]PZW34232.1 hypothetical protein EI42_01069 [Thermosporothrix hazakensis]
MGAIYPLFLAIEYHSGLAGTLTPGSGQSARSRAMGTIRLRPPNVYPGAQPATAVPAQGSATPGTVTHSAKAGRNRLASVDSLEREGSRRGRNVLEIQMLEALAHATCQEQSQAQTPLLQAVKLAQPENYQRLFLDEGPMMESLLKTILPELRNPSLLSFVRTLLLAFARERDVLSP